MEKKPLYQEEEDYEEEEYEEEGEEEEESQSTIMFDETFNETGNFQTDPETDLNILKDINTVTFSNPNGDNQNLEKTIKGKLDILDLDIASIPKEELISLLLKVEQGEKKKKNSYKFNPKNKINRLKMQTMPVGNDPELSEDFNVALTKILSKMISENPENKNKEIFDILLSDKDKITEELKKFNLGKKANIDEKVKSYLEKKNKGLEILQDKLNDDFNKIYTFCPHTNNKDKNKRNFNQFWEDQLNHKIKIKEKVDVMREVKVNKNNFEIQQGPKINKNSVKMVEEKLKKEEINAPVYDRLYSKRNAAARSLINTPSALNQENKKVDERTRILYEDALNRQKKHKEMLNTKISETGPKLNVNSNKFIFKNFEKSFRKNVELILTNHTENLPLNKINFSQMMIFLQNMNFSSIESDESINLNTNSDDKPLSSKNQEKRLVNDMYESIKDKDGLINLEHVFIFCLSILNLLEYYILKNYTMSNVENLIDEQLTIDINSQRSSKKSLKNSTSAKTIKKSSSVLSLSENVLSTLVTKLNNDLQSRIITTRKYGGFDEEDNYILSFSHSKFIFKDFTLFALNYNSSISRKTDKSQQQEINEFKPTINPKSKEMCNKFKQRMLDQIEIVKMKEYNSNENPNEDYLHLLTLKKKKQEMINQKLREEKLLKELEDCTFKPKINSYNNRDNIAPCDTNGFQKEMRVEKLHKIGTEMIINKRDKTKEDVEMERFGNECTFNPTINKKEKVNFSTSNVAKDSDVQKYNERMKRGRMEREVKDSIFKRGEELKSPLRVIEQRNKSETRITPNKTSNRKLNLSPMRAANGTSKEHKDQIIINSNNIGPKLIIDVNIRPGEKRKILVFNGDTSKQLADKFAQENNLDNQMKQKLQNMIESQLARLLPKITEDEKESRSIKSETSNDTFKRYL